MKSDHIETTNIRLFFQVTDLFRAESILIMGIVEVAKHNHFFFYCINNDRDSRCAFALSPGSPLPCFHAVDEHWCVDSKASTNVQVAKAMKPDEPSRSLHPQGYGSGFFSLARVFVRLAIEHNVRWPEPLL